MDYLLKSSAIIALFYISYRLFLERETFFESSRWYLLIGLLTAAFLPSVVIPIYIEYTPAVSSTPVYFTEVISNPQSQKGSVDWLEIGSMIYLIGIIFFAGKLTIELLSLHKLIKSNSKVRVGRYSLIEVLEKIAPFSFFNWIVYNPKQFKKQELNYIINHEKIHAKEHHTIDNLLVQICCVIFWFNPLIWLYKKELQQNLEFIADQKAQTISDCKESYQKLLLKASVPHQHLAITNNFYNSLIKKRIIMLHKSKSNKLNAWKYALIIPILAIFLMSFNTKEVYIARETEALPIIQKDFIITSTSSEADLKMITNYFKNKTVQVKFSDIERNSDNSLKALTLNTKYKDGSDFIKRMRVSNFDSNVIAPFKISFDSKQEDITLNILEEDSEAQITKQEITLAPDKTLAKFDNANSKDNAQREDQNLGENPLYVIGGKTYKKEDLPGNKFTTKGRIEVLNKPEATRRFGKPGKDGAIILNGTTTFSEPSLVSFPNKITVTITKNFTEADLNLAKAQLEKEGLKVKFKGVKRNNLGEIIAIKIDASSNDSEANYNLNGDDPINPISISFDADGDNISIGNASAQKPSTFTFRSHEIRDRSARARERASRDRDRARYESRNNGFTYSIKAHDCSEDCEHNNHVEYEFHSDDNHDDDHEVILRSGKAYVIKNSNSNNGKRVVTITNEDGEDEIIELKSDNNVYALKKFPHSTQHVRSSGSNNVFFEAKPGTTATWVSDEDNDKVEYKFLNKDKGNFLFISTDDNEKPYILLDGKEITQKQMNELDSDSIKSVNVLKGDSATSKYGDKAKDGAIIITTKE
ncbi:hypothetical protein C1T31_07710 [Hanstruepera neustonica]|uniref:Peptidase M56 domain-containing protein n=1 Tax=Hanstruepera neustonica TaxID=1445657 RepID=A0A2K1DZF0_9FLAO|nr:M56 family metallopeptidase [Hanstruepera neustonica]PNQ73391.1 hypothetical protein C1T31_07710 [Hanstruepera neustonica]